MKINLVNSPLEKKTDQFVGLPVLNAEEKVTCLTFSSGGHIDIPQ